MKKYDYSRMARTSKRLIDRFGDEVTFVVITQVPNVEKWKPATVTETEIITNAVFTKEEEKYENGVLVQHAKEKVLFYKIGVSFDPNLIGHIKRGTETWKFSNVKIVNPAGTVLIYTAEVTR